MSAADAAGAAGATRARGVTAAQLQGVLRAHQRAQVPIGRTLYRAYLAVLCIGLPLGLTARNLLAERGNAPLGPQVPVTSPGIAVGLAVTLAAIVLAGARAAVWHGPVVRGRADVHWLLTTPFPRAELLRPWLVRGLVTGAALGAGLGALLWMTLVALLPDPTVGLLGVCVGVCAALGGITAALSWAVECDERLALWVLRASPLVAVVLAAAALRPATPGVVAASLWSGPWGWATTVMLGAEGRDVAWLPALVLLVVTTALAAALALRHAGAVPMEQLLRRATTSKDVAAGLFLLDLRSADLARQEAVRQIAGRRRLRIPLPRRKWAALPWVGAVALARSPGRVGRAALLVAVATLAARRLTTGAGLIWGLIAFMAAQLAATAVVEPVRIEDEERFADRFLPAGAAGRTTALMLVPGVLLAVLAAAAAALPVLGPRPDAPTTSALLWVVPLIVAPGLVIGATVGALLGSPGAELLVQGGLSSQKWVATVLLGPAIAALLVLPVVGVAVQGVAGGDPPGVALTTTLVVAAALTFMALRFFRTWVDRPQT